MSNYDIYIRLIQFGNYNHVSNSLLKWVAVNTYPHWKVELARLEPRLGRNNAIVAMARKLLISVWYILSQQAKDRFAKPEAIAQKLLKFAY
jgi:transposase